MGEGAGGGKHVTFPLTPALSPAFAEAASRRQAPGEREGRVFSKEFLILKKRESGGLARPFVDS